MFPIDFCQSDKGQGHLCLQHKFAAQAFCDKGAGGAGACPVLQTDSFLISYDHVS